MIDNTILRYILISIVLITGVFFIRQVTIPTEEPEPTRPYADEMQEDTGDARNASEYELIDDTQDFQSSGTDLEVSAELPTADDVFKEAEYAPLQLTFKHTKPGEYSEIFVEGFGFQPNEKMIVYLKKTGSDEYEPGGHEVYADAEGTISTVFTVYSYGSYNVELFYSARGDFVETIVVN